MFHNFFDNSFWSSSEVVVEAYANGRSFQIWTKIDVEISGSSREFFN